MEFKLKYTLFFIEKHFVHIVIDEYGALDEEGVNVFSAELLYIRNAINWPISNVSLIILGFLVQTVSVEVEAVEMKQIMILDIVKPVGNKTKKTLT